MHDSEKQTAQQYKAVYVGFKFPHMGAHAGYDLIRDSVGYDRHVDCQGIYSRFLLFMSNKSIFARVYAKIFGSYMILAEMYCLLVALKPGRFVFHFIYAENTYRYLGYFKWLGFRVVCTYHQPVSFFQENPSYLRGLHFVDQVIVLSEDARVYFAKLVGADKVNFVPHGVDTDFFSPKVTLSGRKEILMVGNWMRNFEFANEVFQILLSRDPEINVVIVSLPHNKKFFSDHPRIEFVSGISDEDLLNRYRSAAVLFLPLNGFVANNAVLEMASVGAPIVVASNQQPDDSLKSLVSYVPLDRDLAINAILEQISRGLSNLNNLRAFVLRNYSWKVIGDSTRKIITSKL